MFFVKSLLLQAANRRRSRTACGAELKTWFAGAGGEDETASCFIEHSLKG